MDADVIVVLKVCPPSRQSHRLLTTSLLNIDERIDAFMNLHASRKALMRLFNHACMSVDSFELGWSG